MNIPPSRQLPPGSAPMPWRMHTIGRATREEAWEIFCKYHNQRFSFTDCTSFVTMKTFRIVEAFTLDADFRVMGFLTRPQP